MAIRLLTDFIQEDLIISMLIDSLDKNLVANQVVDVTSQITLGLGSSYKIPGAGNFSVVDYTTSAAVTMQNATDTAAYIYVDKFKGVPYKLDAVDIYESSALNLAAVMANRSGMDLATYIDADTFSTLFNGATSASNLGISTSAISIATDADAIDYVEEIAMTLSENNIASDMVLILPPFLAKKLVTAKARTIENEALAGDIVPGVVGTLYGINIYESNNMPKGTAGGLAAGEYGVIAGKRSCFHLVKGLTYFDTGKSENGAYVYNHNAQTWGSGFSQPLAWYRGVVRKA
jgi:hypothetical protein